MINENGGKMPDAIGIPEEQLRQAARAVRLQDQHRLRPASGHDRHHPRSTSTSIRITSTRASTSSPPAPTSRPLVEHKLMDVLGCAGKA